MSDNKREATFHAPPVVSGPPGVLGPPPMAEAWMLTGDRWGAQPHWADLTKPEPAQPLSPWDLAVQHGWDLDKTPRKRSTVLLVFLGLLVVLVISLAFIARSLNILPVGLPLIGKDSGVAACQAIADNGSPTGVTGEKMSQEQYVELRGVFADSRYPAIRDNGTALIDVAWQIEGMGDDPGLGILVYVQQMTQAYSGLTGGCAEVGYTLPPLTAN